MRIGKSRVTLMTLLSMLLLVPPVSACTIFTASQDGTVIFGSNEDWYDIDSFVTFKPAIGDGYGQMYVGTEEWYAEGGMNTEGLCYDAAAIPSVSMNDHPEKSWPSTWPPVLMLETCSMVEEAIGLFDSFRYDSSISWQLLVADRNGAAAVFAPGADGEWNYTMKEGVFQVATNFNLASNPYYQYCSRYNTATEMLSDMGSNISVEYFTEILDAVHNPGIGGGATIYSNIFDLVNQEMYLFYMHDFHRYIRFNLADELELGYKQYLIADLFSEETTASSSTTTSTSSVQTESGADDLFF